MNEKGFLLVESIIAMGLTTMAVIIILMIYTNGYSSYIKQNDKIDVQENLRIAMNRMSGEIRLAAEAPVITGGTDITVKLKKSGGGFETIRYYYDPAGKEIQRSINGEANNPVASNISSLSFVYNSSEKSVTIGLNGSKGRSGVVELQTKVSLRLL